jgi:hypothetical protein
MSSSPRTYCLINEIQKLSPGRRVGATDSSSCPRSRVIHHVTSGPETVSQAFGACVRESVNRYRGSA